MRSLSPAELLDAWESGQPRSPVERALLLLRAANPETSGEDLARLPIGRRDALLLTLREHVFGPQIVALARCPQCGERLEQAFTVDEIRVPQPAEPASPVCVTVDGSEVRLRLPNSLDLAALAPCADVVEARRQLAAQCVLGEEDRSEERHSPEPLSGTALEAIARSMAEADPQADIHLGQSCPECAHGWQEDFDILSFFWRELTAWASRTLYDVHRLAAAYGWGESDILAISPWRRQAYLQLI